MTCVKMCTSESTYQVSEDNPVSNQFIKSVYANDSQKHSSDSAKNSSIHISWLHVLKLPTSDG